jgi:hypothetical protein
VIHSAIFTMSFRALTAAALAQWIWQDVHAELLQVVVLARHGNRAPNLEAAMLCPNFKSTLKMFDGPYESLTGRGMEQLLELGNDIRDQYINNMSFIPASLDMEMVYFRAGDSSRTLQVHRAGWIV